MPDYDDYDFSLYAQPLQLPMISSRGCVRRCSFCDVHSHWNKYTYRTGQHIFNEMITLHEKYKVKSFHFVDSLINGNLKEYRNLTKLLAEYNQSVDPQEKFSWYGYFIIRPKEDFTEQDWQLTSLSGAKLLNTGLETLNESVRKDIGKNFSNQDVEFSFQMAKKYGGIKFNLLLITGFPNETLEDYEFQIQWWKEQTKYKDIIEGVNTGNPLGIIDNTPLKQNFNQLGLVSIGPYPGDWVNPKNNNTPEERVKWNDMLVKAIAELGYTNSAGYDSHYIIERMRLKN